MPDIIMHSYTMRDFPCEQAFAHAAECGYDGIELQRIHFKEHYLENELPQCMELAEEYDVPVYCVDFTGDLISDEKATRDESIKLIEKNIRICGEYGVPLMNGFTGFLVADPDNWGANGSAIATDVHFERAADGLRNLASVAEEADVVLTLEVHMNTIHDTIASTFKLLTMVNSDYVQSNPDPGNMHATSTAETDPASLDLLKDRIGYFHFKNCARTETGFNYDGFLATGDIDFTRWVKRAFELGFDKPMCIEYVGGGDAKAAAKEDLPYLRSIIEAARQ